VAEQFGGTYACSRAQHDRQALRALRADNILKPGQINFEDFTIEKENGRQRLILR